MSEAPLIPRPGRSSTAFFRPTRFLMNSDCSFLLLNAIPFDRRETQMGTNPRCTPGLANLSYPFSRLGSFDPDFNFIHLLSGLLCIALESTRLSPPFCLSLLFESSVSYRAFHTPTTPFLKTSHFPQRALQSMTSRHAVLCFPFPRPPDLCDPSAPNNDICSSERFFNYPVLDPVPLSHLKPQCSRLPSRQ